MKASSVQRTCFLTQVFGCTQKLGWRTELTAVRWHKTLPDTTLQLKQVLGILVAALQLCFMLAYLLTGAASYRVVMMSMTNTFPQSSFLPLLIHPCVGLEQSSHLAEAGAWMGSTNSPCVSPFSKGLMGASERGRAEKQKDSARNGQTVMIKKAETMLHRFLLLPRWGYKSRIKITEFGYRMGSSSC